MRNFTTGTVLVILLIGSAHAGGDELCSRLKTFETAPFAATHDNAKGNWVTISWDRDNDSVTGYAVGCAYDEKSVAEKTFCEWLVQNTSHEFHYGLPIRILQCHGFVVPHPYPLMYPWIGSVKLDGTDKNKVVVLDVALGGHDGPDALRLAVLDEVLAITKPLPPLFPPKDFTGELRQR